jgi:uncharacterized caspase-like protein
MNFYLLAIGINDYFDEAIPNLQFAENDARDVYNVFSDATSKKSFHGKLLTGEQATLTQIKSYAGERIAGEAKKEDAVLIYFAGHGAVEMLPGSNFRMDASNYLVPHDAVNKHLYSSAFSLTKDLPTLLDRISAEHITVILDCCFSGGSGYRGARGIEGFYLQMAKLTTGTDPTSKVVGVSGTPIDLGIGRVILMACGPDQVAIESSDLKNGIFTHFLVKTISENSGQGHVSSTLVHDEVTKAVLSFTNGSQYPVLEGRLQGHKMIVSE